MAPSHDSGLVRATKAEASITEASRAAARAAGVGEREVRVRGNPNRVAPARYRDAVEHYARQFGVHGDVVWVPNPVNCWQVRFTLKPGDPRRRKDNGDLYETVELHYWVDPSDPEWANEPKVLDKLARDHVNARKPGYVAYELDELGVSGLIELLEKGSLLSGRGEFESAQDAVQVVAERERDRRRRERNHRRDRTKSMARAVRRQTLKIPFLPVGIEIGGRTQKE